MLWIRAYCNEKMVDWNTERMFCNSNENKIDSFNCLAIEYQTCTTGPVIEKRLINSGVILLIIIVSIV